MGEVIEQVGTVSTGVEGGVLGEGGSGGVELEAGMGEGAGSLAVGVDPDASVAGGVVSEVRRGAGEGSSAGGENGGCGAG